MTRALLLILLAGPVNGVATHQHTTYPCLGGVRVTPEMIKHDKTVSKGRVYSIYAGSAVPEGPRLAMVKTDSKGQFSVSLKPGVYCVVDGDPEPPSDAGVELTDALACSGSLAIEDGKATLTTSSANRCNQPWAKPGYHGPMPP